MSKIIFCDNSLHSLILFRKDVYESYAQDGVDIVLVAQEDCKFETEFPNIKFIPVSMNATGTNPLEDLKYFRRLLALYKMERPDYVFHYTIKPNIYGSIAARICRIPSTAVVAGLGTTFSGGRKNNAIVELYRFALRYPEHVLVLNKDNMEVLMKRKIARREQLIWLPGGEGVNLDKFRQ